MIFINLILAEREIDGKILWRTRGGVKPWIEIYIYICTRFQSLTVFCLFSKLFKLNINIVFILIVLVFTVWNNQLVFTW